MKKIGKKAALLDNETIELIIAAVAIFVIILLVWKLLAPSFFNKQDETAKSFFDTLQKEIAKADSGTGEFLIYGASDFYLIYFENGREASFDGKTFVTDKPYLNAVCICSSKADSCKAAYCKEIKVSGFTGMKNNDRIEITKSGSEYVFRKL